jgi:hydroxymethylglutaryl-CoA reductase
MPLSPEAEKYFSGFSKLSRAQRYQRLLAMGVLSTADIEYLKSGGVQTLDLAENLIENVIGYLQIPLGVATNFKIDGNDYVIPMAVEETSIIAAVSKTARWIRNSGQLTTWIEGNAIIGQIQIAEVSNYDALASAIERNKSYLIDLANQHAASTLVARGGGVNDIQVRQLPRPDGKQMAVIHVLLDPCDAMGANLVTQVCEFLKSPIESLSGEQVTLCILSNLSDSKLTHAKVVLDNVEATLGQAIENASLFAQCDPYRAATHNKGVLNGIDSVLLATGNDWRAVEAGVHAYAARDGQYRAITTWHYQANRLVGTFKAPIMVGTVGGVTRLHPTAQLALKMLGINTANELARIVSAVGLVQNLGALKALTTTGLIQGHMKLHISNLALATDADEGERSVLKKRLENFLHNSNRLTQQTAMDILQEIRELKLAKS